MLIRGPKIRVNPRKSAVLLSSFLTLATLAAASAGCASTPAPRALKPRPPRADIVFLIHGIWPDGGWYADAAPAFESASVTAVPIDYTTFLPGFMFGFGTDRAAEQVVALAGDL